MFFDNFYSDQSWYGIGQNALSLYTLCYHLLMKKALLLFGVAGCCCAGGAEKPSPAKERVDQLWAEIDSGKITEITDSHLKDLSTADQDLVLKSL